MLDLYTHLAVFDVMSKYLERRHEVLALLHSIRSAQKFGFGLYTQNPMAASEELAYIQAARWLINHLQISDIDFLAEPSVQGELLSCHHRDHPLHEDVEYLLHIVRPLPIEH